MSALPFMNTTPLVPHYIAGEWLRSTQLATTSVFNPSTGDVIAQCPVGGTAEVNAAVAAAHAAFPSSAPAFFSATAS